MAQFTPSAQLLPPEKPSLRLGFIPLTDCAPLVVAQDRGYFADEGLEVTLEREASWANIRDKVLLGALDGAHMLATMPLAATLGVAGPRKPLVTGLALSLGGNAITVSTALYARMGELAAGLDADLPCSAEPLRRVLEADYGLGREALTFAMVFPSSTHAYQLRYWLAAGGVDPDRDVRLVVIPPEQMVRHLEAGEIAGYCVGEPWNSVAVARGLGVSLISSYDLWNNAVEKVFGVTESWAERYPRTHEAVLRALLRAAKWLDGGAARREAARILADGRYVGAPVEVLETALSGLFRYHPTLARRVQLDFLVFHRYLANFPWHSHGLWYAGQMRRWGQVGPEVDLEAAVARSYRTDLYREAATGLGLPCPPQDHKAEGSHDGEWLLRVPDGPVLMGPDRFFSDSAGVAAADPVAAAERRGPLTP